MSEFFSYSFLLAVALASDLLFLAIGAGVAMHPYSIWLNLKAAVVFSLTQLIMAVFAINIGVIISGLIPDFSNVAGLLLMAFVGLKFILETNKVKNDSRTFLIEDSRILFGLALAASFNTLLAYTGFGMILTDYTLLPAFVLPVIVFFTVLAGIFIGNKYRPERLGRFSKYFGGIIIIFLAVYLLFQ